MNVISCKYGMNDVICVNVTKYNTANFQHTSEIESLWVCIFHLMKYCTILLRESRIIQIYFI